MNDQHAPSPFETGPLDPFDQPAVSPFQSAAPADAAATSETPERAPAAAFTGHTPRKTPAIRAGIVVGTGLLLAVGTAVAMGASPSASPSSGGDQTQIQPGTIGNGHGFGHLFGGPLGQLGGPGADGQGLGHDGLGFKDGRGFGQISVTAINGNNVSLATEDGWTRTITVTSTTTITKGGAAATLADLAVGDVIRFRQTRNSDGTFTIAAIEIVQPRVAGTVTAVTSDTITITLRDGTTGTIHTTGSTTYHVEDADGTRSDVTVGAVIVAKGEKASDGSLNAASVWIRLPHVAGTVTATTSSTITISRPDGTSVTIHVGSGTTIRVAGIDSASLSDIKTGMIVVAEGTQRADGSIDARAIGAGQPGLFKGRGHDKQLDPTPDASAAPGASGSTTG
ncbi:MAG TPA: DUF5666 domain-containing protein [Candidatus Limnocylindrales bacterium]